MPLPSWAISREENLRSPRHRRQVRRQLLRTPTTPAPSIAAVTAPAPLPAAVAGAKGATVSAKPDGAKVYASGCNVCHAAGVAGAPKFGDKAPGRPRLGARPRRAYGVSDQGQRRNAAARRRGQRQRRRPARRRRTHGGGSEVAAAFDDRGTAYSSSGSTSIFHRNARALFAQRSEPAAQQRVQLRTVVRFYQQLRSRYAGQSLQ